MKEPSGLVYSELFPWQFEISRIIGCFVKSNYSLGILQWICFHIQMAVTMEENLPSKFSYLNVFVNITFELFCELGPMIQGRCDDLNQE